MTRRNVKNERNTIPDKKTGTTRRSASSAKPARAVAGSVYVVDNKKTKAEKKEEERQKQEERRRIEDAIVAKYGGTNTKRMRNLRAIWWVLLSLAIICTALAWFARNFMPDWAAVATMIAAYVFIIAALATEFVFIRKERKTAEANVDAAIKAAGGKNKLYREEERRIRAEMRAEKKAAKENGEEKPKTGVAAAPGKAKAAAEAAKKKIATESEAADK